jgi:hypothetical protein
MALREHRKGLRMSGEATVMIERHGIGAASGWRAAKRVGSLRMAAVALFTLVTSCSTSSSSSPRGAMDLWFDLPASDVQTLGLWVHVRGQSGGHVDLSSLDAVLCTLDSSVERTDAGALPCLPSLRIAVTSASQLDGVLVVPFDGRTRPLVAARLVNANGEVVQSAFARPPTSVQPASLDGSADAQDASDAGDTSEASEVADIAIADADETANIVPSPDAEAGAVEADADASDASMDVAGDFGDSGAGES